MSLPPDGVGGLPGLIHRQSADAEVEIPTTENLVDGCNHNGAAVDQQAVHRTTCLVVASDHQQHAKPFVAYICKTFGLSVQGNIAAIREITPFYAGAHR